MNECAACGLDFGSVHAFDAHRVGNHGYDWSPDREDGRRCLAREELIRAGWHLDRNGRWRTPRPETRFYEGRTPPNALEGSTL